MLGGIRYSQSQKLVQEIRLLSHLLNVHLLLPQLIWDCLNNLLHHTMDLSRITIDSFLLDWAETCWLTCSDTSVGWYLAFNIYTKVSSRDKNFLHIYKLYVCILPLAQPTWDNLNIIVGYSHQKISFYI